MKFTRNRKDMGLIRLDKGRIWLANNTSEAHVVLTWTEVGRGLFPLSWGLELLPLNIGSHLRAVFS
jgi:hypothetical protein